MSGARRLSISPRPDAPADETFGFNLQRFELPYNESKRRADELVLSAGSPGLETVVVSPGFTFGSWRDGYRGGEVIERVLRRRVVPCTNGGLSVVHVDDVVAGIRRAAARGRAGERYILSGQNLTFHEIARTVARVSGEKKLVVTVPDVARDLAGAVLNSERARRRGRGPLLFLNRCYAYQYYSSAKALCEHGTRGAAVRGDRPGRAPAPAAALSRQRAPATKRSNSETTKAIISLVRGGLTPDPERPVHDDVAVRQLADRAELDVLVGRLTRQVAAEEEPRRDLPAPRDAGRARCGRTEPPRGS